jgi:hypothetical protein
MGSPPARNCRGSRACRHQAKRDESIARNANVEYLYDRLYKARGVVRVAGPFTVESFSPHRVLPLGEAPYLAEILSSDEDAHSVDKPVKPAHDEVGGAVQTDFAQVVYENLKTADVQNTKKGETLKFEWLQAVRLAFGPQFIDHDYDEESFFVRQAYFVGDDPYDALKRALKAEIDETAWAELNATISRPFATPKHGRICVKVINHFGDEVQKVFFV